jgi:hypothetical protein
MGFMDKFKDMSQQLRHKAEEAMSNMQKQSDRESRDVGESTREKSRKGDDGGSEG